MPFYRRLLLLHRSLLRSSAAIPHPSASTAVRSYAFSSADEAAAARRRLKRNLRLQPPSIARQPSSAPRPPRDPSSPRLPDSTSSLVGPRLNLHNTVQRSLRSGDLDAASAAARHAVFSSTRPTVFTCNAVSAAMLRAGRLDDVIALFSFFHHQSHIIPNVVSYNILINAHCAAGRVDTALSVYRTLLATAPFPPSAVTYRHLVNGLVDAGRLLPDAMDLLREMFARGLAADSLVYNTLIAGFIHLGNMDKALDLFAELTERCVVYDGVVVATLMEGYFNRGMEKQAMESYHSYIARQFKMSTDTSNTLLQTLLKHDRADEADKLFEQMVDSHCPYPHSYITVNAESYNIMVNHRFQEGKPAEAIEVFRMTGNKPCTMDVGCFNNIIGKLCENGLFSEAEKLLDEMPGRSVKPDAATFRFLIDGFFREGRELGSFNKIIGMLCENGLLSEAEKLFEEMLCKSVNPDVVTYGFMIDGFLRENRLEDAVRYFEKFVASSEGADVPTYNKVFDGLVKAGYSDRAMKFFEKMTERGLEPTATSYDILVTGLCREGNLERGLVLLEEIVSKGVSITSEVRDIVYEAFGKAGRSTEIERLLPLDTHTGKQDEVPVDTANVAPEAQQAATC